MSGAVTHGVSQVVWTFGRYEGQAGAENSCGQEGPWRRGPHRGCRVRPHGDHGHTQHPGERRRTAVQDVPLDLYLSFVLAGHHNLVQYWLEKRPDLSPRVVAGLLNRLFYTPFFVGPSQGQGDGRI